MLARRRLIACNGQRIGDDDEQRSREDEARQRADEATQRAEEAKQREAERRQRIDENYQRGQEYLERRAWARAAESFTAVIDAQKARRALTPRSTGRRTRSTN